MENLERFIKAQESSWETALNEIKNGSKRSHWIWFIFPQMKGLGRSYTSDFYGIENLKEAKAYLQHPILGSRLREITNVLLELNQTDARDIFYSDSKKVKSCMTLFSLANEGTGEEDVFKKVLDKYYKGYFDRRTLEILGMKAK